MALDIDERLAELTLAEKVGLLCGAGGCSTNSVPRLSIPKLYVRHQSSALKQDDGRLTPLSPVELRWPAWRAGWWWPLLQPGKRSFLDILREPAVVVEL